MIRRGYLREHSAWLGLVLRILDIVSVIGSGCIVYYWRFKYHDNFWYIYKFYPITYVYAFILVVILSFLCFVHFPLYRTWRGVSLFNEFKVIFLSWSTAWIILATCSYLLRIGPQYSRLWGFGWYFLGLIFLFAFRLLLRLFLRFLRHQGFNSRSICLVGTGMCGKSVYDRINSAQYSGFNFVAVFGDKYPTNQKIHRGDIDQCANWLMKNSVDQLWFAMPLEKADIVRSICYELRHLTLDIRYVPDLFAFQLLNHSMTEIEGIPVVNLNVSPIDGVNKYVKRFEDIILSTIILFLISPLMILISILIKATSKGSVFFKQKRHGWNGEIITIWKFRSMETHTERSGSVTQASKGDKRVTPVGKFLRMTSLDELPQFLNVIQGRMSIVGPRPHAMEHNELYKDQIDMYMKRHKVKPGITGWAQINGYRGETDTLDKMRKRIEHDIYYIENWSLWFDLKIILLTIFKGFIHKNAY